MFTTGAGVIVTTYIHTYIHKHTYINCVSTIQIEFRKLKGLGRCPITHTCGCVLEIPSTYDSFSEFGTEFTNVLAKEKWQNDVM